MHTVRVDLGPRSYDIVIGEGILEEIGRAVAPFGFSGCIALVSNPTVYGLYGASVAAALRGSGFTVTEISIPDGEEHKNLASAGSIYDAVLTARLDRKSALIALGGGVIGDIAGFAASTFMRGIDYIQIPTTLLAQVDSSVGGKTAVNHAAGKNMIGTFWQPRLVWIDINSLGTLPRREFLAGIAEIIKYGVIRDETLFSFLEENRERILGLEPEALTFVIRRSCEIKADVVSRDERESGLRAILNFGHTIGHAVETTTGYSRFLHGEAVAIGMLHESRLACSLGRISDAVVERIRSLILAYGLPTDLPSDVSSQDMISVMQVDKKAVAGNLRFALPERIGSVAVRSGIPSELLVSTLQ